MQESLKIYIWTIIFLFLSDPWPRIYSHIRLLYTIIASTIGHIKNRHRRLTVHENCAILQEEILFYIQ